MADNKEKKENHSKASLEQDRKIQESTIKMKRGFKLLLSEFFIFMRQLLSLRDETDYEQTRVGIERDIPFRGPAVYILICSIFIASIGLNLNSPAVIIGAMLIAPLMGPILGVGLALGTNDLDLLWKALKNFGVMVFISLVTSTLYFLITPLVEYQPEILARTTPTTLDILVAIFGGIAGIVAGSRKEKNNVIPGVAIATALMPPLCTSGFGLATGNWNFFFGAFYLFMLNSIFICGSTVIGVRYLRFPLKKFLNKQRERKVRYWMAVIMIIMIFPSLWIFYGVLKQSWFRSHAEQFVQKVVFMEGARMVERKFIYNDSIPTIEIFMIGKEIPKDTVKKWESRMEEFSLELCRLDVFGIGDREVEEPNIEMMSGKIKETIQADVVRDLFKLNQKEMIDHEEKINFLEKEISKLKPRNLKLSSMAKELKIQFEDIEKLSYADAMESDMKDKVDTIPTILVKWRNGISKSKIKRDQSKIGQIIQIRLELDTVRVIQY